MMKLLCIDNVTNLKFSKYISILSDKNRYVCHFDLDRIDRETLHILKLFRYFFYCEMIISVVGFGPAPLMRIRLIHIGFRLIKMCSTSAPVSRSNNNFKGRCRCANL